MTPAAESRPARPVATSGTRPPRAVADLPAAQRRTLIVLVTAQILSGAGLAAGVTVGSLLAQELLSSTSLAGLPSALGTAGSVLAAAIVARISQSRGRRPGLATGYLLGALGSVGVIAGAAADSPALFFTGLFVYGAGTSTNLQARYAGADLASPAHRARAVSTVLVATTVGGVAGPLLAAPTGDLSAGLGIPYLAGPFLLSGAAYAIAALVLAVWLRPDPLLLARTVDLGPDEPSARPEQRRTGVTVGTLIMVITQLVMVAIMTMTPVHLQHHGHGTAASGVVIAIHLAAMYLPSPLTGWLVDRYNPVAIAVASGLTLLAAGVVAASASDVAPLAVALALLGLGWNLGLVSGTAIVAGATRAATRASTQGLVDVCIAIAGAFGGLASGVVVAEAGYPLLAVGGGVLALTVVPVVVLAARLDCRQHRRREECGP
ncbi:MFS transporter [Kribbella sp. DT2]|uniref:MFS transporter n=1 Tax=Kribbella sp. DT2 TaxID=3393427 RepID=UPI003CF95509